MGDKNEKYLDYVAAKASQEICEGLEEKVDPKTVETLVTKALGVLQSQGVYAMALFLFSRSGSKTAKEEMNQEERAATQILSYLWALRNPNKIEFEDKQADNQTSDQNTGKHIKIDIPPEQINSKKSEMLNDFANLTSDLDTLLLVRDLYEQTLIYARYHAKAAQKS